MSPTPPYLKGGIMLFLFAILGLLFYRSTTSLEFEDGYGTDLDYGTVIAIDLGSAYSRVAYGNASDMRETYMRATFARNWDDIYEARSQLAFGQQTDNVKVLSDDTGNKFIPSCVAFTEHGSLIGDAARLWAIQSPEATICDARALLGRSWSDPNMQTLIEDRPYKISSDEQDKLILKVNVGGHEETYTPEYVVSLIIGELKRMAEVALGDGEKVTHAVVTVPNYYDDHQHQAIKDAGTLAGINVLRLLDESRASSVAYLLDAASAKHIVVFDMGNTLDVSVLFVEEGVFEVLATSHRDIGGKDFNQRLFDYLDRILRKRTSVDITANHPDIVELKHQVEKAKIALSSNRVTRVDIGPIDPTLPVQYARRSETLTRSKFDDLHKDLFKAAMDVIPQVLVEAKLNITDIDHIILTGGSGNIPKVAEMVEAFFGKTLLSRLRSEAIIKGAALQGTMLFADTGTTACGFSVDVGPLSIGIETVGGINTNLTSRNSWLPLRTVQNFSTAIDEQSSMLIRVLQGERVVAADNLLIGEFELPLTPAPAGIPRVEITLSYGMDGAIRVTATDTTTKRSESIVISSYTMWTEEYGHPNGSDYDRAFLGDWPSWKIDVDADLRALVAARVDLESYLAVLVERLDDSRELGNKYGKRYDRVGHPMGAPMPRSAILDAVVKAQEWLVTNRNAESLEGFKAKKEAISRMVTPFVGEFQYDVVYRVGGAVGGQHNEL
ncbi:HSP70-domain-containing protein [Xylariaceae sp. AK1471]|nr:HSP70-domain-containing protein [Xylariaceae sp. AK1471]